MSYPQRYPNLPNRYPPTFPLNRSGPSVNPPPFPWGTPGAVNPTAIDGAYHHTSTYALPDDAYAFTPGTQRTPWAGLPRDLQLDPDQEWPYFMGRPAPYFNYRPGWHPAADPDLSRRPYTEHFGNHMDQHQRRLKWRDEILKGDPEKAIADHVMEASRLVISLITRGPLGQPFGQGDEVLSFRASRKPPGHPGAPDLMTSWTYFALDASSLFPLNEEDVIPSAAELSKRSFSGLIPTLDFDKDLKLVRRSKPLLWDNTTVLETFLYRIVEDKEDPESEAGRALAERLGGPHYHRWTRISDIREHQQSESDIVSTALLSVYFPHALSMALDNILSDKDSRADQLSMKALDALYLCVQGLFARSCFHYYPIPPPHNDQKDLEVCVKRRVWAYWTEVMAWHLSNLREDAQVSISYSLLKALSAIKPSVDDTKVSLDNLEKLMINAIATEAERCTNVTRKLIQEGISECLYNPHFAPPEDLLQKMHIITAGTSSTVFNVIAKLITHVLSRRTSPLEGSNKSIINRRIFDLKITIAESRPLAEGVALAMKLSRVVDSYTEYRDRTSKGAKRTSGVPSATELGPAALDSDIQARLRQVMMETEQLRSPLRLQSHSLGLSHLLADLDAKKEKKEPKVTIELITDAAVVSTVMASGGSGVRPIVLLSADRILSSGNAVNKVGSAQMSWAAKSSGGIVLFLCRADRVHSKSLPTPAKLSSPWEQLIPGWKSLDEEESLNEFLESSHLTVSNPTYEDISREHITGYITEIGFMGHDMLAQFSDMRDDLEKIVWPVNPLTK